MSTPKTTAITRRAALGAITAAGAAAKKKPADDRLTLFNVTLPQPADLVLRNGNDEIKIGKAISIPQVCQSEQYGTPEWIKEITYVDTSLCSNPTDAEAYASDAEKYLRVGNNSLAKGCGHMSKNVKIKQGVQDNNGVWFEKEYSNKLFYCLVAYGHPDKDSGYAADTIWISETDWDINNPKVKERLMDVCCHRTLPKSECGNLAGRPCSELLCKSESGLRK